MQTALSWVLTATVKNPWLSPIYSLNYKYLCRFYICMHSIPFILSLRCGPFNTCPFVYDSSDISHELLFWARHCARCRKYKCEQDRWTLYYFVQLHITEKPKQMRSLFLSYINEDQRYSHRLGWKSHAVGSQACISFCSAMPSSTSPHGSRWLLELQPGKPLSTLLEGEGWPWVHPLPFKEALWKSS